MWCAYSTNGWMSTGTLTDFMRRDVAAKMPGDPRSTLIAGLVGNEADRETSRPEPPRENWERRRSAVAGDVADGENLR